MADAAPPTRYQRGAALGNLCKAVADASDKDAELALGHALGMPYSVFTEPGAMPEDGAHVILVALRLAGERADARGYARGYLSALEKVAEYATGEAASCNHPTAPERRVGALRPHSKAAAFERIAEWARAQKAAFEREQTS